jgi:predicted regulator of Ras-like GTPase activity (Roadblock/LC7/MglB family)
MTVASRLAVSGILVIIIVVASGAHAQVPDGVSPGAVDHVAAIEGRCPFFSWGVVPGAEHYELVCYRLPEGVEPSEVDLGETEQVLYTEVPGAAAAWTPDLAQCLAVGESYVWFVRAVFREEHGEVVEASEWSYGRFFEISTTPSAGELEDALRVLRRYAGDGRGAAAAIDPETDEADVTGTDPPAARQRSDPLWHDAKSVPSAKTAIRGSLSDTTGETYGVVGISNSAEGAGVGAAGAEGGPDLVLDGSADGLTDTGLSQSWIDRRSADPQTFNIENSGGGGMTLQLDGVDVLTTAATIDAETLDGFDSVDLATDAELAVHATSADHDGRYFTESELSTSGGGGAVHWDNLTSVPVDLADGDDDTLPILPGTSWGLHAVTTIDSEGGVGVSTSITVGADGLPVISYYDHTNDSLKVAHCSDLECTSATTYTVDSGGGADLGRYTSITVGADGLPVISYHDYTNKDLKVAHCSDVACTDATIHIVDGTESVGEYTSITVGADGLPVISYYDYTNLDLKMAHCSNLDCSSANVATVDHVDLVGHSTSIAVGSDGLPIMSYHDITNNDLRVAHCSDLVCSTATTTTIDGGGDVGRYTSIAVGSDGLAVVSYYDLTNTALKVAHCSNLECASATTSTVDSEGVAGIDTSITIGADSLPIISYYESSFKDLKVAHCSNLECSAVTVTTVDSEEWIGEYTSITVGADGLPIISYRDSTNLDLKVAHCANVFCIPYARPR